MTEEQTKKVTKKRGRKPKVEKVDVPKEGITIDADGAAVEIRCKYSDREKFAFRLFDEYGVSGKGLLLKCNACGTSVNFQAPDRVPTMNTQCGSKMHMLIRWISID